MRCFINYGLRENSLNVVGEGKLVNFLLATTDADKDIQPLAWWKKYLQRVPHIAAATKRFPAM